MMSVTIYQKMSPEKLIPIQDLQVLILVLMEDTLRDCYDSYSCCSYWVLILVLMEDTLRDIEAKGFENDVFVLILVLMEDTLREYTNPFSNSDTKS